MQLKRRELLAGGLAFSAATVLSARNVYSAEWPSHLNPGR